MTAGLNVAMRVIRLVYGDDDVGGSEPSGTILHEWVDARLDENVPNPDMLGQGLEVIKTYSFTAWGHELKWKEQDEVDVIHTPNHRNYGDRFRIIALQGDSVHPAQKRAYWNGTLRRSDQAHRNGFQ